jgi:hypothetical protein
VENVTAYCTVCTQHPQAGPLKQHLLGLWLVNKNNVTAAVITWLQVLDQISLQKDSMQWFPAG